jgi:probable rRNA maturation factor
MKTADTVQRHMIDCTVEEPRWGERIDDPSRWAADIAGTVFSQICEGGSACFEVSIVLGGDDRVRALNRTYRKKDRPTNVLSFPQGGRNDGRRLLGDVVLAFQTAEREAEDQGKPFADHATHLLVHGLLHLLGYDHGEDDDAAIMEAEEARVLKGLGIADPYRAGVTDPDLQPSAQD